MPPLLERTDHVHVFVSDRAAAEQWYFDALGFTRLAELEFWSVDDGPLIIGNPSRTIQLALFERPAEKCRSTVAFGATAVEFAAWRTHLAGVFGLLLEPVDHEVAWSLYFSDPDGNPFEITTDEYAGVTAQLGGNRGSA